MTKPPPSVENTLNRAVPYALRYSEMLNAAKHSSMSTWSVIARNGAFFYGWIFLGLVAAGALDKNGWRWLFN